MRYKQVNAESLRRVLSETQEQASNRSFAFNESFPVDIGIRQIGTIAADRLSIKEPDRSK